MTYRVGTTVKVTPEGVTGVGFEYTVVASSERIVFLWNRQRGVMQSRPCLVEQADGLWENSSGIRYRLAEV